MKNKRYSKNICCVTIGVLKFNPMKEILTATFAALTLISLTGCAGNDIDQKVKALMQPKVSCKVWFDSEPPIMGEFPYEFTSSKWSKRAIYEVGQKVIIVLVNEDLYTANFYAVSSEVEDKLTMGANQQLYQKPTYTEHRYKLNSQSVGIYKVGRVYEEEFEILFNNNKTKIIKNKIYCLKK